MKCYIILVFHVKASITNKCGRGGSAAILTDSLFNLLSIAAPGIRDAKEGEIMRRLTRLSEGHVKVLLQFVRGHEGHFGNEAADRIAGTISGTDLYDNSRVWPLNLVKSRAKLAQCKKMKKELVNLNISTGTRTIV